MLPSDLPTGISPPNGATRFQLTGEELLKSVKAEIDFPDKLDNSKAAAAALLCVAMCTMHDTPPAVQNALLLIVFGILMYGMLRDQYAVAGVVNYTETNSVILHDALGRRLVLPLELCESDTVSAFISIYESDYPLT